MYRQNAHTMNYLIINDQHKFSAWDPTKQKSTRVPSQQDGWGCPSFTKALRNSKTNPILMIIYNSGLEHVPASVLGTQHNCIPEQVYKHYAPNIYRYEASTSMCFSLSEMIAQTKVWSNGVSNPDMFPT